MIRITAACPENRRDDGNSFAMVTGQAPDYAETYAELLYQDASGNTYAAASFEAPPEWITAAQSTLQRPAWDVEPYAINMAGARRAQAALVFWTPDMGGDAPLARPDALVAIGGVDGPAALAMMGLAPIPVAGPV